MSGIPIFSGVLGYSVITIKGDINSWLTLSISSSFSVVLEGKKSTSLKIFGFKDEIPVLRITITFYNLAIWKTGLVLNQIDTSES